MEQKSLLVSRVTKLSLVPAEIIFSVNIINGCDVLSPEQGWAFGVKGTVQCGLSWFSIFKTVLICQVICYSVQHIPKLMQC